MVGAGAQVTRGGPGAAPGRETGARAAGARGGPGAAPSREAGARATGTHGSPGAAPNREAGAIVLTGCLYAGVPGLQVPTMHVNLVRLCYLSTAVINSEELTLTLGSITCSWNHSSNRSDIITRSSLVSE
jgi:hypothetical protein